MPIMETEIPRPKKYDGINRGVLDDIRKMKPGQSFKTPSTYMTVQVIISRARSSRRNPLRGIYEVAAEGDGARIWRIS